MSSRTHARGLCWNPERNVSEKHCFPSFLSHLICYSRDFPQIRWTVRTPSRPVMMPMLTTVHSMKKASCPICLGIHEICSSCKIKAIFTPSLYRLSTLNGKAPRVSANWLILRKGRVLEAGLHIKTVLPIFARLASSQKSMILVGDQEKYLAVLWMRVNHIPQPVPGVCLLEVRGVW